MDFFKTGKSLFDGIKNGTSADAGGENTNNGSSGFNPISKLFGFLDKNNDGKITEEEFVSLVKEAGFLGTVAEPIVKQIFHALDTNKNGVLETSEALAAFERVKDLFKVSTNSSNPSNKSN